jgi:DNA-binding NarL/FixJ family response regulator
MDGIAATTAIRDRHPETNVVVLTTYSDDESISAALAAGALGYLTKDAGREDIRRALEAASRGQALLDAAVHQRIAAMASRQVVEPDKLPDALTDREIEVLSLIGRGLSNQEVASALFVSEATVKTHINHIFAKTHCRDRAQAVAYAHRHGLA